MDIEGKRRIYHRGLIAEHLAAVCLMAKGYTVLARRYKTPVGEIDLVVRRGKTLVFVEVKERGALNAALESVTARMKDRIACAGRYFLARHPQYAACDIRFDLVATSGIFIRHLDNAWQAAA